MLIYVAQEQMRSTIYVYEQTNKQQLATERERERETAMEEYFLRE